MSRPVCLLLLGLLLAATSAGCLGDEPAADAVVPAATWVLREVTPLDDSASEVSIAVDPLDPLHAVASANSGGFGVYETRDGGCSWAASTLAFTDIAGATGPIGALLSDPAVGFSPDGTLRIAGLAYAPLSNVFVASRAGDGGPWRGDAVWRSEIGATFNDKEWMGISPGTGTIVVAWQREPAMDNLRGVEQSVAALAGSSPDLDIGQILVSRSADGGATWSLPVTVGPSLHNNGTQVVVTGDGAFHLVWVDYEQPALVHSVSTDDGASWSAPVTISDLVIAHTFGSFSRMHTLPGLATDGERLAVVWHDARFDTADVLLSAYDGSSWSPAERVPDDDAGADRIQLYPWVAFDGDGTLHVSYYSGESTGTAFTYRDLTKGPAWGTPQPLGRAFDLYNSTSLADVGDYTGSAHSGGRLYIAWAQPQADGIGSTVAIAALRSDSCP